MQVLNAFSIFQTNFSVRDFRTHDVYPANVNEAILHGLEAGQQYQLRVMAFNNIGESNNTSGQPVIITTPGNILIDS